VQTFTHPLWLLVLAGGALVLPNLYFAAILLNVLASVAAVLWYAGRLAGTGMSAAVGVTILLLSKAFTDYSTSGLENALTHLLLVALLATYYRQRPANPAWGLLLLSLLMLNRLDLVLLAGPPVAWMLWQRRSSVRWWQCALAVAPLVGWEVFAVIYYGSPVPNVAYAKLNTSLPAAALIARGARYLLATVEQDPLTAAMLGAGLCSVWAWGRRRDYAPVVGIVLYLLYVVRIGGDFMAGRFLTAPLLVSVIVATQPRWPRHIAVAVWLLVVAVGVLPQRSPLRSGSDYGINLIKFSPGGICDERAFYYQHVGLLKVLTGRSIPDHEYVFDGLEARRTGKQLDTSYAIGMYGYYAGPGLHIVDLLGLGDPLLARLPPEISDHWRIGHLARRLPPGYLETLRAGRNRISDPRAARLWELIRQATREPLWSTARWRAILRLNLARLDQGPGR